MLECPLLAISGLFGVLRGASALPPKADIRIAIPHQPLTNVRFAPESRHSNGDTPKVTLWMSALPPKADIGEGIAECPLMTQSGHSPNPQNFPCPRHRPPGWTANRPHDDRHLRSDDVLQLLADLFSTADIGDRWRYSVYKIATSDSLQQCFWPASSDLALPSKSHEAIPRGDG